MQSSWANSIETRSKRPSQDVSSQKQSSHKLTRSCHWLTRKLTKCYRVKVDSVESEGWTSNVHRVSIDSSEHFCLQQYQIATASPLTRSSNSIEVKRPSSSCSLIESIAASIPSKF
ncbi:hypothetical protein ACOSQ3_019101 [Xanthoceras sorbifolium]